MPAGLCGRGRPGGARLTEDPAGEAGGGTVRIRQNLWHVAPCQAVEFAWKNLKEAGGAASWDQVINIGDAPTESSAR